VIPSTSLRAALCDDRLLGHTLGGPSWSAWRTLLIAAMGEPLTPDEREVFSTLTGRPHPPSQRVEEAAFVVGRRGGKSRACATLAVYIATLCRHDLSPGERGVALLTCPDQRQAKIALEYAEAAIEGSPILRQLIASRTADTLELSNGITIEVRAASFRRLRGPTYICVIADEAAFWPPSDTSANPDTEILNAVRPGLATTRGPLIIASSPYARRGVLWDTYRRHYGPEGDSQILVAQGPTRTFNPSLPQSVVDRAIERDRTAASAEYLALFRADIEGFVPLEVVEACVGDYVEIPPAEGTKYFAFVDPSGGSSDSFTLAVSHRQENQIIIDATRERRPPFSPEQTITDLCALLRSYRITQVTGDRYAGEFPREHFRKNGITYRTADKTKSDLYRDLLPALNSGTVVLPRADRLTAQLVGLERRTARSGRDSIDHAPNSHDDLANACAGAADLARERRGTGIVATTWDGNLIWSSTPEPRGGAANRHSAPDSAVHADPKPLAAGLTRRLGPVRLW
jgi:hypothetical protein